MSAGSPQGSRRRFDDAHPAEALARFASALSLAGTRAEVVDAVEKLAPAVLDAHAARCAAPHEVAAPDSDPLTWHSVHLPLRYGDDIPLGSVRVRWDRAVDDADGLPDLLRAVADLTSQALQRIELIASAAAMARLANRLSCTRSPAEAIAVILDDASAVLGASLPALAVREDSGRVRFHSRDLPAELSAAFTDVSMADPRPIVEAIRTGRRVVLPDRASFRARYPHLPDHAGDYGIVSTVAVPLHDSRGHAVAALGLGWRHPRHFGHDELARLDTLADLCEQTLERTRLVAAEHHLITRLATRMHSPNTAVPAGLDVEVRYRPAMRGLNLGGDWYDLINLPDGRFAVVVGDIVGHHIEAAADMAQLRTILNTLIRLDVPLDTVFARFTTLAGRAFWGTAVILVVDMATCRAEIVRAGHPHPVLVRPGRPPVPLATGPTTPLGLTGAPSPVSTVPFEPGDVLVAYTDGLVEQRRHDYDGAVDALHAVIGGLGGLASATEIADGILDRATDSEDDQALVVVRRSGAAASPLASGEPGAGTPRAVRTRGPGG